MPQSVAALVFARLKTFGGHAFAKSHAATFVVLVYQWALLKRYYPAAFYAGLLNNQPMGFWSRAVLAADTRRHETRILPVDIYQRPGARCTVEANAIRLGLVSVSRLASQISAIGVE